MPADVLRGAVVAVYEGGVGGPGAGGLEGEALAGLVGGDTVGDFAVDGGGDERFDVVEVGGDFADVLGRVGEWFWLGGKRGLTVSLEPL